MQIRTNPIGIDLDIARQRKCESPRESPADTQYTPCKFYSDEYFFKLNRVNHSDLSFAIEWIGWPKYAQSNSSEQSSNYFRCLISTAVICQLINPADWSVPSPSLHAVHSTNAIVNGHMCFDRFVEGHQMRNRWSGNRERGRQRGGGRARKKGGGREGEAEAGCVNILPIKL